MIEESGPNNVIGGLKKKSKTNSEGYERGHIEIFNMTQILFYVVGTTNVPGSIGSGMEYSVGEEKETSNIIKSRN